MTIFIEYIDNAPVILTTDDGTEIDLSKYTNIEVECDVHRVYASIPMLKIMKENKPLVDALTNRAITLLKDLGCTCDRIRCGNMLPRY